MKKQMLILAKFLFRTDEWSRKLFPLAFCFFNIIYWSYYTKWSVVEHAFEQHWVRVSARSNETTRVQNAVNLSFRWKTAAKKELSDNFSNIFELIDRMINSNNLQRSQLFKSLQRRKLIIFFSPNNLLSISSLKIISNKICKKSEKLKSCENLHKTCIEVSKYRPILLIYKNYGFFSEAEIQTLKFD